MRRARVAKGLERVSSNLECRPECLAERNVRGADLQVSPLLGATCWLGWEVVLCLGSVLWLELVLAQLSAGLGRQCICRDNDGLENGLIRVWYLLLGRYQRVFLRKCGHRSIFYDQFVEERHWPTTLLVNLLPPLVVSLLFRSRSAFIHWSSLLCCGSQLSVPFLLMSSSYELICMASVNSVKSKSKSKCWKKSSVTIGGADSAVSLNVGVSMDG